MNMTTEAELENAAAAAAPGEVAQQLPAGAIVAFGGHAIPAGWALCDGSEVSAENPAFARLWAAIGNAWGSSGYPMFCLPDLQGRFLRGVTGASGRDAGLAERSPPRPDKREQGNTGNAPGSVQAASFEVHHHDIGGPKLVAEAGDGFEGHGFTSNSNQGGGTFSTDNRGGSETRPINAYVHYIIKL